MNNKVMVFCMSENKYKIKYHAFSVIGNTRQDNEDNVFCNGVSRGIEDEGVFSCHGEFESDNNILLAVFDGMGGGEKGELASSMSAEKAKEFSFQGDNPQERLLDYIKEINRDVHSLATTNGYENMGTTFAGVLFTQDKMIVGNVGDSKIFAVTGGKTKQLSLDHSLPEELAFHNIITQYIGMDENSKEFSPEISQYDYNQGTKLVICSDGLTENLSPEQIGALCYVAESVSDASDILVSQALTLGGNDNISVIVCEITEST